MAKKYLFEYLDTRKCKVVTSYTQLSKLSGLSPWIISQQFKNKNCYYDRDGKFRITVTEVETDIAKMRKSKL